MSEPIMDESDLLQAMNRQAQQIQRAVAHLHLAQAELKAALEHKQSADPWPALPIVPQITTKLASIARAALAMGEVKGGAK